MTMRASPYPSPRQNAKAKLRQELRGVTGGRLYIARPLFHKVGMLHFAS